jgi:hypothetical protein
MDCFRDKSQNIFYLRRSATGARFTKPLKFLSNRPSSTSIERQSHAVFGQIDCRRHKIIDRSQACFFEYIVVDDSKILQMRVAIAQRAVESGEREELFEIGIDMRRIRELLEPLQN